MQIEEQTTFGYYYRPLLCFWCVSRTERSRPSGFNTDQTTTGTQPISKPTLPFLLSRIRSYIPMVKTTSSDTHLIVRLIHDHGTLPSFGTRRILLGPEWYMESCRRRPGRVSGWAYWLVRA